MAAPTSATIHVAILWSPSACSPRLQFLRILITDRVCPSRHFSTMVKWSSTWCACCETRDDPWIFKALCWIEDTCASAPSKSAAPSWTLVFISKFPISGSLFFELDFVYLFSAHAKSSLIRWFLSFFQSALYIIITTSQHSCLLIDIIIPFAILIYILIIISTC